jgi:hypothetical protein
MRDQQTMRSLEDLRRACYHAAPEAISVVERRLQAVRDRICPELKAIRERERKTARFIERWGWDKLWELYLERLDSGEISSDGMFCVAVCSTEQGSTRPIPTEHLDASVRTGK